MDSFSLYPTAVAQKLLMNRIYSSESSPNIMATLEENGENLNIHHVARAYFRFIELEMTPEEFSKMYARRIEPIILSNLKKIVSHKSQHVEILKSMAHMGHTDKTILKEIVDQLREENLSQEQYTNVLWALAKLNYYDQDLVDHLLDEAYTDCAYLTPKQLSSIVWTLVEFNIRDKKLMKSIAKGAEHLAEDFTPGELSILARGYGFFKIKVDKLTTILTDEFIERGKSFSAQNLSVITEAFANLEQINKGFFHYFKPIAKKMMGEFTAEHISRIVKPLAELGLYSKRLCSGFAKRGVELVRLAPMKSLCTIHGAFTKLHYNHQDFTEAVINRVRENSNSLDQEDRAYFSLSLIRTISSDRETSMKQMQLIMIMLNDFFSEDFLQTSLRIKQSVYLAAEACRVCYHQSLPQKTKTHFLNLKREIETKTKPNSSNFHRFVSKRLRSLGFEHFNEVLTAGGWIDIVSKDGTVAIEVDGTCHKNRRHVYKDRLREKILRADGIKLYRVTQEKWNKCFLIRVKEEAYLQSILDQISLHNKKHQDRPAEAFKKKLRTK